MGLWSSGLMVSPINDEVRHCAALQSHSENISQMTVPLQGIDPRFETAMHIRWNCMRLLVSSEPEPYGKKTCIASEIPGGPTIFFSSEVNIKFYI